MPDQPSTQHARRRLVVLLGATVGAAALASQVAFAREDDHELARQALQQGKVLSLRQVLERVERQYPGQVLKVEFEHEEGRFLYKLRVLQANGQMVKIRMNAVDGRILAARQRGDD